MSSSGSTTAGKSTRGFGSFATDASASSLFDSVFSKPASRRRPNRPTFAEDKERDVLPSVVLDPSSSNSPDNAGVDENHLRKMMSPPVSLPESSSTEGDTFADNCAYDSDDEIAGDTPVVTSTLHARRPAKHAIPSSSTFDFDEELDSDPSSNAPYPKRQKALDDEDARVQYERVTLLSKNEQKPVYRHKWSAGADSGPNSEDEDPVAFGNKSDLQTHASVSSQPSSMLRHGDDWRSSSGHETYAESCRKVRNVKDAHECLESGELDDYKHDLDYILSSLKDASANTNTKCLSTITLARKCVVPDFRQFIRSKSLVNTVFRALQDAPLDPNMALCASTVVYLMCRDYISMRVDATTLRLLANLLRMERAPSDAVNDKYHAQICEVFRGYLEKSEIAGKKIQFEIDEEDISPSSLILESMVYILARNNDETVKTELLTLGALQWIVSKVEKIVLRLAHEKLTATDGRKLLVPLERCFRVLEMCTLFHKKNQAFLISHRGSVLIHSCAKLISVQHERVAGSEPNSEYARAQIACLSMMARVLMNLSHENELCCTKLGQINGFLPLCLSSFTYLAPKYAPEDKKFDLYVMMCSLMVNLVERCNANRRKLIDTKIKIFDKISLKEDELPALEALTKLFLQREEMAKMIDEDLDRDLVMEEPEVEDCNDDSDNDTRTDGRLDRGKIDDLSEAEMLMHVQSAMNKASAHMEDSVVASYVALLVGCLLQQNEDAVTRVRDLLPNNRLDTMIEQLQRFLEFMNIASNRKAGCRSIERIVDHLERLNSE